MLGYYYLFPTGKGNSEVECKLCGDKSWAGATRVRGHLLALKSCGWVSCLFNPECLQLLAADKQLALEGLAEVMLHAGVREGQEEAGSGTWMQ